MAAKSFIKGELKYKIENHTNTPRGCHLSCQRPWGCLDNAVSGKIGARNKIFSLFAPVYVSQGVDAAKAIASAVSSPINA